ncbi:MAG TPA: phasin family protein [Anaeromyxobacter sp.]|nr:phasin family protein [Anaeromyxobacter sp.]
MTDIQTLFREAWSNALAGVNAAEQEAERVFMRIADAAGLSPDEVRRQAREFGERLASQRREVERAVDEAVRKAASRFKIPSREDIEALERRVDALAQRIEELAKGRDA